MGWQISELNNSVAAEQSSSSGQAAQTKSNSFSINNTSKLAPGGLSRQKTVSLGGTPRLILMKKCLRSSLRQQKATMRCYANSAAVAPRTASLEIKNEDVSYPMESPIFPIFLGSGRY